MNPQIRMNKLLRELREDISALPPAAVELTAAMVVVQSAIPKNLTDWIYQELGQRADLSVVSPSAEAMMRITATFLYKTQDFHESEIDSGVALLRALELEDQVTLAAEFLATVAKRLEDNLCGV